MGDKGNKSKTQSDILGEANKILKQLNKMVDRAADDKNKDSKKAKVDRKDKDDR